MFKKLVVAILVTIVMGATFGSSAVSARETKPTQKSDCQRMQRDAREHGITDFVDCTPPTLSRICDQEKKSASEEGITNFDCTSFTPLDENSKVADNVTHAGNNRRVKVTIRDDNTFEVSRSDVNISVATGVVPTTAAMTAQAVLNYPYSCNYSVCTVTLSNSISLGAFGYTCASMSYRQTYDVYKPWRALLNVRTPVVNSNASYPCSEQGRNTWTNPYSMPWWYESGADITWNQSIFLYGIGTIRTWHRTLGAHFDGLYNYNWIT